MHVREKLVNVRVNWCVEHETFRERNKWLARSNLQPNGSWNTSTWKRVTIWRIPAVMLGTVCLVCLEQFYASIRMLLVCVQNARKVDLSSVNCYNVIDSTKVINVNLIEMKIVKFNRRANPIGKK